MNRSIKGFQKLTELVKSEEYTKEHSKPKEGAKEHLDSTIEQLEKALAYIREHDMQESELYWDDIPLREDELMIILAILKRNKARLDLH